MGDDGHWMEKAFANSHGQFKAKAKRAGKSTAAEAKSVLKPGSHASTKTKRQANLAEIGAKYGGGHHSASHPDRRQENPGEADMHTHPVVPHSFRPPATSGAHGYGHGTSQHHGHHRHSGHPGAHRIGHK